RGLSAGGDSAAALRAPGRPSLVAPDPAPAAQGLGARQRRRPPVGDSLAHGGVDVLPARRPRRQPSAPDLPPGPPPRRTFGYLEVRTGNPEKGHGCTVAPGALLGGMGGARSPPC